MELLGHGLRTPNEGINQRNLKILADVANKICFGCTKNFGSGSWFSDMQWRWFPHPASVVRVLMHLRLFFMIPQSQAQLCPGMSHLGDQSLPYPSTYINQELLVSFCCKIIRWFTRNCNLLLFFQMKITDFWITDLLHEMPYNYDTA